MHVERERAGTLVSYASVLKRLNFRFGSYKYIIVHYHPFPIHGLIYEIHIIKYLAFIKTNNL